MSESFLFRPRLVGILIFDQVEVLDFCGPFEVFTLARPAEDWADTHLFKPVTIAEESRTVTCYGGLRVQPDFTIADHPPLDILLIPGGMGVMQVNENPRLMNWISDQAMLVDIAASVCTGSLLYAQRGLLTRQQATTHWGSIGWFREHHPNVDVLADARFVESGRFITAAGVSAGIDMSLHLVERLHGAEVASWTARLMEYDHYKPLATPDA